MHLLFANLIIAALLRIEDAMCTNVLRLRYSRIQERHTRLVWIAIRRLR
jgi:hypothetical protein